MSNNKDIRKFPLTPEECYDIPNVNTLTNVLLHYMDLGMKISFEKLGYRNYLIKVENHKGEVPTSLPEDHFHQIPNVLEEAYRKLK